jgi:TRAP-type C4-dicarboxylate transport system substrate-binding protein
MNKLSRRTAILGATGLSLTAPFIHKAAAQTRWQFATPYPDGNFHTRNLREFVTEVQAAVNGLQIQVHSGASLLKMPEIKRGVQTGQAQLGEILLSAYGNEDPFFEVDSVPQLVTSTDQARKLAQLQRPLVEARLQRQGVTLLYMVPWPPSGLYTNVPLESVETLRGMKMRTFNALTNRFATLSGATPTLVQQAEVPQAFATGVVNSMVTSAATGVDVQAWDFCKFFTPIGFTRTKNAVFVQTRALQSLPEASQRAIRAAAAAAEARGGQVSDVEAVERQNMLASRGMTIGTPTPTLMQGLARIGATQADEWVAKAGEEGKRLMDAYRAAIA